MNNQVLLIFLGAILTFVGTWSVESFKNWREKTDRATNLELLVKQELLIVIKCFDLLKTTLDFRNYYDYGVLTQLDESVANLKLYKRDAIYFPDQGKQTKYIDLVSDVSSYVAGTRGLQNMIDDEKRRLQATKVVGQSKLRSLSQGLFNSIKDTDDYFDKQKMEKALISIELKRRIDEFVKLLS